MATPAKKTVVPPVAPDIPFPTSDGFKPVRDLAEKITAAAIAPRRTTTGVWVHYRMINEELVSLSIHAEQLDARIAAMDAEITGKVVFVPWDGSIEGAIAQGAQK